MEVGKMTDIKHEWKESSVDNRDGTIHYKCANCPATGQMVGAKGNIELDPLYYDQKCVTPLKGDPAKRPNPAKTLAPNYKPKKEESQNPNTNIIESIPQSVVKPPKKRKHLPTKRMEFKIFKIAGVKVGDPGKATTEIKAKAINVDLDKVELTIKNLNMKEIQRQLGIECLPNDRFILKIEKSNSQSTFDE